MIVLDASYTLALVMPDETRPSTMAQVLKQRLATPVIWPLELANALRTSVRRGRLDPSQVSSLCGRIDALGVELVATVSDKPLRHYEAALHHDLTPYDTLYLDLALQWRSGLATRDEPLALAAQAAGVTVFR